MPLLLCTRCDLVSSIRLELAVFELILTTGTLPHAQSGLGWARLVFECDTHTTRHHPSGAWPFSRTYGGVA